MDLALVTVEKLMKDRSPRRVIVVFIVGLLVSWLWYRQIWRALSRSSDSVL